MTNQLQGLPSWRLLSRISVILFTFYVVISLITVSIRGTEVGQKLLPTKPSPQGAHFAESKGIDQQELWNKAKVKYSHLADDKFTITMLTYRRPKELNHTLAVLLEEKIPSLHEIVVIWGDVQADMPKNFKSKHNVPVRFRMAFKDSLNEKLRPDPQIETQAVLLTDDDVYYRPKDLEFVFQSWRKFGKYRLTGALARCADVDAEGTYNYNFCSGKQRDSYSMILTNLCFSHMSFLDYYWSNDRTTINVRDYVDLVFNCEDIALNYVQGLLTGQGPLLVRGQESYVNLNPPTGISTKPGHLEARSRCLNDFTKLFECMPLVNETARIQSGI